MKKYYFCINDLWLHVNYSFQNNEIVIAQRFNDP